MLTLNNSLLTSDRIIEYFTKEVAPKPYDPSSKAPSAINQLKNKLRSNFFYGWVGCDLALMSISPDSELDLKKLSKKIPTLIKQNDQYFLDGLSIKLDSAMIEEAALHFPAIGEESVTIPYKMDNTELYKNLVKKNERINLNKRPSDEEILYILENDPRFKSAYPQLKHILKTIFLLGDTSNPKDVLEQFHAFEGTDWNHSEAETRARWDSLNKQFGYFNPTTPAQMTLFTDLAISCQTMILLEENHSKNDLLAYDYAYKLMALFVDTSSPLPTFDVIANQTNKFLTQSDHNKTDPFRHLLMKTLKLPNISNLDRAGWYKFVKQEGEKSFPFLKIAGDIEHILSQQPGETMSRAPKSMKEAKEIELLCKYPRATESAQSMEFAKLCYQYDVEGSRFNRGLDYMASGWPKKTKPDSLPELTIEGQKSTNTQGYYWVKVPARDMRSLIMGDITGCCQSIGGKTAEGKPAPKSEQCVMDSISLSDNGIYVLLKKQSKKVDALPVVNGTINDVDFQIIGQAYAWKSQTGNICLDSIETLKGSVTESALGTIVSAFATEVLQADNSIKFVTLGAGGKTPRMPISAAAIPEKMRQGYNYGDADRQFCIAKSPYQALDEQAREALDVLLEDYERPFKRCIHYLSHYVDEPEHFVERLSVMLKKYPAIASDLNSESLFKLLSLSPSPSLQDLVPVNFDELDQLSAEEKTIASQRLSLAQLIWRETTPTGVLRALPYVAKSQRFDAIMAKNELGQSVLHFAVDDPSVLVALLSDMSESQRIQVLNQKDSMSQSVLDLIRNNPATLSAVLASFSDNMQSRVLERSSDLMGSFGMYAEKEGAPSHLKHTPTPNTEFADFLTQINTLRNVKKQAAGKENEIIKKTTQYKESIDKLPGKPPSEDLSGNIQRDPFDES